MIQKYSFVVLLIAASLWRGCDIDLGFGDDSEPLPATELLDVIVDPNPVATGDTTRLIAVVKDSLRTDLTYGWAVWGAGIIVGTNGRNVSNGESKSILVIAGSDTSEHRGRVEVYASDGSSSITAIGFDIKVASAE